MDDRIATRARTPRYTFAQAVPLVGRPVATVRRWSVGNRRKRDGRAVQDAPLLVIDGELGTGNLPLSFLNLLELQTSPSTATTRPPCGPSAVRWRTPGSTSTSRAP